MDASLIFGILALFFLWTLVGFGIWSLAVYLGVPEDDPMGTFTFGVIWPVGVCVIALYFAGSILVSAIDHVRGKGG